MYFATRPRPSLTAVYSDSGYAVITDHALSNIIFKILRFFLLKVDVIFLILEVNFGILVEVICPASKSQCCKGIFALMEQAQNSETETN